jgi:hypothetical protein
MPSIQTTIVVSSSFFNIPCGQTFLDFVLPFKWSEREVKRYVPMLIGLFHWKMPSFYFFHCFFQSFDCLMPLGCR